MNRRLAVYILAGTLFGVFDFVYLGFLRELPAQRVFGATPAGQALQFIVMFAVLNLGIWLIPAIPAALYEARHSGSRGRAALASVVLWSAGIIAYYLAYAAQFALGVPGREELAVAQLKSPYFWSNWASVLRYDAIGGMIEYAPVALLGGALIGWAAGSIYLNTATPAASRPHP